VGEVLWYGEVTENLRELHELLRDLLNNAEATGDYTRAWRNMEFAQVWVKDPRSFYEALAKGIEKELSR
jgi:hypothetical protein